MIECFFAYNLLLTMNICEIKTSALSNYYYLFNQSICKWNFNTRAHYYVSLLKSKSSNDLYHDESIFFFFMSQVNKLNENYINIDVQEELDALWQCINSLILNETQLENLIAYISGCITK